MVPCNVDVIANITDTSMLRSAISRSTFLDTINTLFHNTGAFPLHSILSVAAKDVLGTKILIFKGFHTSTERRYLILVVAFLSTTIIFSVVVLCVYCEDRRMKMENKLVEPKRLKPPKGPSLLTPIAEKEIASSYSAFHQLKKKHMQKRRDSSDRELLSPDHFSSEQGVNGKYTRLLSGSGDSVNNLNGHKGPAVTHTEVTLGDPSES